MATRLRMTTAVLALTVASGAFGLPAMAQSGLAEGSFVVAQSEDQELRQLRRQIQRVQRAINKGDDNAQTRQQLQQLEDEYARRQQQVQQQGGQQQQQQQQGGQQQQDQQRARDEQRRQQEEQRRAEEEQRQQRQLQRQQDEERRAQEERRQQRQLQRQQDEERRAQEERRQQRQLQRQQEEQRRAEEEQRQQRQLQRQQDEERRAQEERRQQQQQQQQQTQQGGSGGNDNREARRLLLDNRPVDRLNDRELRALIASGSSLIAAGAVRDRLERQLRERVQQARGELDRRGGNAGSGGSAGGGENREARRFLSDNRPVSRLNDRELRDLIGTGRNLIQSGAVRDRLERQVRDRVEEARDELDNRRGGASSGNGGGGRAERAARRLLADNRPSRSLRDDALRQRVDALREVLGDDRLDQGLSRQLRRMLAADRDELRARIARNDDRGRDRVGDRMDEAQLLRDRRPAERLRTPQLRARIEAARAALDNRGLRGRERDYIEAMIRGDRRELRSRFLTDRSQRRGRLRGNDLRIVLPGVRVVVPRDNIDAAEVDDDALQEQLIAPPRRAIEERYTRSQIRSRPDLRDYMPGIEVDTIRFGFNEDFVREEEIPQLERIGEIIERIVASNPDEVFMVEGHTDAVGSASYNQALSERRAEAVRDALTQFFNIDVSNIEVVGYGEQFLKIETLEEESENRRVTIRRITPLLTGQR